MENKYYTPNLTDLHIGYECEWYDINIWESKVLDKYGLFASLLNETKTSLIKN